MNSPTIDPERVNIPEESWELVEVTDGFVRHRAPLERYPDGTVVYVYRTAPRGLTGLLEDNRRLRDESEHKRFGDGRVVARIPLNVLYQNVERLREGDQDWIKWFVNNPDNRMYRTFRGKV